MSGSARNSIAYATGGRHVPDSELVCLVIVGNTRRTGRSALQPPAICRSRYPDRPAGHRCRTGPGERTPPACPPAAARTPPRRHRLNEAPRLALPRLVPWPRTFTVSGDTPSGLTGGRCGGIQAVLVADPVRVRRLSDQEGQTLQRITRRGTGSPIRLRRAMVVLPRLTSHHFRGRSPPGERPRMHFRHAPRRGSPSSFQCKPMLVPSMAT